MENERTKVIILFLGAFLVVAGISCSSGAKRELNIANLEKAHLQREVRLLRSQLQETRSSLESEKELRKQAEKRWSEQVATLRESLDDSRSTLKESEDRYGIARDELQSFDMMDKRQLKTMVQACEKRVPLVRSVAKEEGMREVWESVQFRGYPRVEKGIIFDDYYYVFEVKVRNKKHHWEVKTEKKESAFSQTLSKIFDLVKVFIPK